MFILANDGWKLFCASRRLWRVYTFALAYLSLRHCTKISCAASDGDFCSIHPGAKTLVSLHICAGVVTGQCNKYQDLSCQWRLWRVCKFTQARLSLVKVPKYHVLARMALGLRLQLGPYCRASFDSKSFHRRTKSSIFNHKSRALPVKTCASYCYCCCCIRDPANSHRLGHNKFRCWEPLWEITWWLCI